MALPKHARTLSLAAEFGRDPGRTGPGTAGDAAAEGDPVDPRYRAYFRLFEAGRYYEAHDVLEDLWLEVRRQQGDAGREATFFKGLIQLAGAFVHLRKQAAEPTHPKHAGRLRPAARLLALSAANLRTTGPRHLGLETDEVTRWADDLAAGIAASDYVRNPWSPEWLPRLSWDPLRVRPLPPSRP